MGPIKGVILDVDGTLVDSNDTHARAWVEAMAGSGYNVSYEKVRSLIGKGSDKLLPETIWVEKVSPEGKELAKKWKEIFNRKFLPELKPFPGTRDLLVKMRASGLKLVVASSSEKDMLIK